MALSFASKSFILLYFDKIGRVSGKISLSKRVNNSRKFQCYFCQIPLFKILHACLFSKRELLKLNCVSATSILKCILFRVGSFNFCHCPTKKDQQKFNFITAVMNTKPLFGGELA